ncbi:MAG: hypothetical protein WAT70_10860, partial [Rhizobiaceae bacterium]
MVPQRPDQRLRAGAARRRGQAKKLTDAARVWAFARAGVSDPRRPATIDAGTRAQFARLGVAVDAEEDKVFGIWPENIEPLSAFLRG